jgi:hypothetical protein
MWVVIVKAYSFCDVVKLLFRIVMRKTEFIKPELPLVKTLAFMVEIENRALLSHSPRHASLRLLQARRAGPGVETADADALGEFPHKKACETMVVYHSSQALP